MTGAWFRTIFYLVHNLFARTCIRETLNLAPTFVVGFDVHGCAGAD